MLCVKTLTGGRGPNAARRTSCRAAALWFAAAAVTAAIWLPSRAQAPQPAGIKRQRIFVIFSYPLGQWSEGIASGLSRQLGVMGVPFELKQYVYDSPFFTQKPENERMAEVERIVQKAQNYHPDFIVVSDDEAADAMMPRLKGFKIPLLFVGINKDEQDIAWLERGRELTGVFERYPAEASLKLLSNLTEGKARTISLITSVNPTSEIIARQFREFFQTHKTKIALHKVYMSNKWDDWKRDIKTANAESDSLWMLVPWNVEDSRGERMDLRVMGKWLSESIKIPSISIVDVNLHLGVMASISMTPQIMGEELADVIRLAAVEHKSLSAIPYRYPSKYEIIINKKQADRLGISIPIELLEYAQVIKDEDLRNEQ